MTESGGGLFGSLKGFADTTLEIVHTRLELFVTEAVEERQRLSSLLAFAVGAVILIALAALLAVAALALAFWESRVAVVAVAALVFGGLGIGCGLLAMRRAQTRSQLFAASLGELRKDRAALRAPDQTP
jgi:uncharacterized membrane protein YqjE